MNKRCIVCDGLLWSDHSKAEGIHPDCKYPDFEQPTDLEARLELVVNSTGVDQPTTPC